MKSNNDSENVMNDISSNFRPTESEMQKLSELEKSGKAESFVKESTKMEKKYAIRSLANVKSIEKEKINPNAFVITDKKNDRQLTLERSVYPGLIAQLIGKQELKCDCLIPFTFRSLRAYTNMSGPDTNSVARGMLGAVRWYTGEYSVFNPGDTVGKGRVHLPGQLHITFMASLPQTGRYCLILPSGNLMIRGASRVIGHGNATTSYDAKVWVDFYSVLYCGNQLLEISGGEIHYDGTRSEDRTRYFGRDIAFPQRAFFFNGNQNENLVLSLRLEADTAANEDGIANVMVNHFGFPANMTSDYDTFVIKT